MTSEWLDSVRRALDARVRPVSVFFRDDDAGWADDALHALLDVFEAEAAPLDVAVIPAACDAVCAAGLKARRASSRLRLHQHGWSHANHEAAGRKSEFGLSRTRSAMQDDVRAGRARLADLLGDIVDPIFTPPWNRCANALAPVLVDTGVRVLSRDTSAGRLEAPGLIECPVTVDWSARRHGAPPSVLSIADELARAIECADTVGVLFHHAVMSVEECALTRALLQTLLASQAARCVPLMEAALC
jgi:hypothetical protein